MGTEFKNMTQEQLLKKLDKLKELLVDTEEVRDIQLSQTGQHLYNNIIPKYAEEIAQINEDIATVKGLLGIED